MVKRVHCEKKTKIYIPKITNPQILTCCKIENKINSEYDSNINLTEEKNIAEKRR